MADYRKMLCVLILAGLVFILSGPSHAYARPHALVIELEGPVSSGAATFLARGIREAENRGAALVIIPMDTPGGLGVSMKTMVKNILNSSVPVVVYVSPGGASAASAGVLIPCPPMWLPWHREPISGQPTRYRPTDRTSMRPWRQRS